MQYRASIRSDLETKHILAKESLYVGIDIGKFFHVAGFLSDTLLRNHERFEGCPALKFDQSREGFHTLVERIRSYVPLEQCFVILEHTGHYHKALQQFLLELDISVYVIHVQARPIGMVKTDKRDALNLANILYNQLKKGIQVPDKTQLVRRAVPPTPAASQLKGLTRHRYELMLEITRRKNKLTAICDELFPELTRVLKDPNSPTALSIRKKYPTPQAIAAASTATLRDTKTGYHPRLEKVTLLQHLGSQSIGTKDQIRQNCLVFEQSQLIEETMLLRTHVEEVDAKIRDIVAQSREGQIIMSMKVIGVNQAGTIIGVIGNIANFESAATLKSYFGWAPKIESSGVSLNKAHLTQGGNRTIRRCMFLIVFNAIQRDSEWKLLYERLMPIKCRYDEKTGSYRGKMKVMGRIAGQIVEMLFAFLKYDQELLSTLPPGSKIPPPMLYDPAVHRSHHKGEYLPLKSARTRKNQMLQAHQPVFPASS